MSTEEGPIVEDTDEQLTRNQKHYARHRDEKLQKVKDRYHSRPEVAARDAVRAQKREEKALLLVEREKRRIEREQRMKERLERFKQTEKVDVDKSTPCAETD